MQKFFEIMSVLVGAAGWIRLRGADHNTLIWWGELAHQARREGEAVPPPPWTVEYDELEAWALEILARAEEEEGSNAPRAQVKREDEHVLVLTWEGTWTGGRSVTVRVEGTDEFQTTHVAWKSGTGSPSRFLSVPRRFCDAVWMTAFFPEEGQVVDWGDCDE